VEIGEASTAPAPASTTVRHATVQLKAVTFSANHPVEQDTLGDFAPPEWLRGRPKQWPICYTRGKTIHLTAKFDVLVAPLAAEDVKIKAQLTVGSATLEWNGSVQCGPSDTEVTTAELESTAPLPNQVWCSDTADIEFLAQPPTESFSSAGTSHNVLYVVLGDPSGTPAFWTLLDISCRAASGATTPVQVVEQSFTPFQGLALTRVRDGKGLTYWNPETTVCTNTAQLLASGDGAGQCGSWAEFLVDLYKCHGITSGEKVLIVRSLPDWQGASAGFLVKNWSFNGAGSHAPPFTHVMGTECVKMMGIAGQRNANPPPAFFNHFITRCFGKFYDPSYGGGPILDQIRWEVGAIDGLFSHGFAGFPKSANPTTLLVQFRSATTGAPL
jgi:hypothetical protein